MGTTLSVSIVSLGLSLDDSNSRLEKLLGQLKGAEREQLVEDIKPQLLALKKYNFGKQIAAIEKLIFTGPAPPHGVHSYSTQNGISTQSSTTKTQPLDINSAVPTPLLTMEQNSPQSSSLPSANVSTVDGPTDPKAAIDISATGVTINTV
jgi:mRNA-binding protein PUF3